MPRKYIIIAGISIVGLTLVGVGLYLFFEEKRGVTIADPEFGAAKGREKTEDVSLSTSTENITEQSEHIFTQVSSSAISGYTTYITKEKELIIRYGERGTGHIYDYNTITQTKEKVTTTTFPKVFQTLWINPQTFVASSFDQTGVLLHYLVTMDESKKTLSKSMIQKEINDITVDTISSIVYYSEITASGSQITRKTLGIKGKEEIIARIPLMDYTLSVVGGTVYIKTRPSVLSVGYMYRVDKNNVLTKVGPDTRMANMLPSFQAGSYLLSFYSDDDTVKLYNVDNKGSKKLSVSTFTDKCAWTFLGDGIICAQDENAFNPRIDSWYKGLFHFNDTLFFLDPKTDYTERIPPSENTPSFDIIKISYRPEYSLILFVDKKTMSLWSVSFKKPIIPEETYE